MQKISQSPSPTKHKIGDFTRYEEPFSPQKGYSFRGKARRPFAWLVYIFLTEKVKS